MRRFLLKPGEHPTGGLVGERWLLNGVGVCPYFTEGKEIVER